MIESVYIYTSIIHVKKDRVENVGISWGTNNVLRNLLNILLNRVKSNENEIVVGWKWSRNLCLLISIVIMLLHLIRHSLLVFSFTILLNFVRVVMFVFYDLQVGFRILSMSRKVIENSRKLIYFESCNCLNFRLVYWKLSHWHFTLRLLVRISVRLNNFF